MRIIGLIAALVLVGSSKEFIVYNEETIVAHHEVLNKRCELTSNFVSLQNASTQYHQLVT